MRMNHLIDDVAIIGGGPVGIFSIFAFGMQGLSCTIIDALDKLGGQCSTLYPDKTIYDIPGFVEITGKELTDNLIKQAMPFDPNIHLNSFVENVRLQDNHYVLTIKKHQTTEEIAAKAIVIALGSGVFKPMTIDGIGLEKFEGKNVFYRIENNEKFVGKKVAIVGAGDSAIDWALELADKAQKVYLIHRRDFVKAHPASWQKVLTHPNIEVKIPYQVVGLEEKLVKELAENNDKLSQSSKQQTALENTSSFAGIIVAHECAKELLNVDYVLPCLGHKLNLGFLTNWNLELINSRIAVDPTTMRTSKPGIYAIGDCVSYNNKRKLILTGFSEAANCATDIFTYLYPDRALKAGHSTTLGVPGKSGA